MWATVLVMAVAVSLEPFRMGMTVIMLNRPQPVRQLAAFLAGGFAMGLGVGLIVLFIFRQTLLSATHLTVPRVQIVIGLLALLVAAGLATKSSAVRTEPAPLAGAVVGSPGGVVLAEPAPAPTLARLPTRVQDLLRGDSLWVAGVVGLGIALPSIDYLAALAVILASGAPPAVQAGALATFNVVAFALVEIPLLSYLAAPDKTRAAMAALSDWIRSRRRRDVAGLLAAVGCVLLVIGVIGL